MLQYLLASGATETWAWRDVGGVRAVSWVPGKSPSDFRTGPSQRPFSTLLGRSSQRQRRGENPEGVGSLQSPLSSAR